MTLGKRAEDWINGLAKSEQEQARAAIHRLRAEKEDEAEVEAHT